MNTNSSEPQTCNIEELTSDCTVNMNYRLNLYVKLFIAVFYTTATVNLFLKIISLFNFKYWLIHRLLFKPKSNEDDLCRQYDDSKSRLFRRHLESRIAENEKYWAENFLDLNLYNNSRAVLAAAPNQSAEAKYLNMETDNFLNEDEQKAIEMIDDALKRTPNSPVEANTNTFKAKKSNKN